MSNQEPISNATLTTCQHCGKTTNYADDDFHRAREERIKWLEAQVKAAMDFDATVITEAFRDYAGAIEKVPHTHTFWKYRQIISAAVRSQADKLEREAKEES